MAYDTTETPLPAREPVAGAVLIPPNLIKPNPWNRKINEASLPDLAASVRKHGVLQPVLVRPAEGASAGQPLYELVAGERRWRASQLAGLAVLPCLVRQMDDLEVIELMLVENLEREDLHPLDEAAGYDRLLRKDSGPQSLRGFATVDHLAERIGKSRSYVVQRLKLLTLCTQAALAFRENEISFSVALRIARLPDAEDQRKATSAALQGWGGEPMSARGMDDFIRREFMLSLRGALFKLDVGRARTHARPACDRPPQQHVDARLAGRRSSPKAAEVEGAARPSDRAGRDRLSDRDGHRAQQPAVHAARARGLAHPLWRGSANAEAAGRALCGRA